MSRSSWSSRHTATCGGGDEWAHAELALEVGMSVFAQIKGVSVAQRDVILTH
ncbi:molybdenum ABC transporter ATP-binding protein [Vibrio cholerae]|nr:molybdenum ABC transporter ATP-binding protein [Vibrio cholerae]